VTSTAATVPLPSGPAYTVVLICHVAALLVGMVTVAAGAVVAGRLLAAGSGPVRTSVRSYFSPGANWAGRVLYLVPVFGALLIAMSGGAYRLGSAWVLWGIGLWVAGMALAEGVLWPAERRVRRALAGQRAGGGRGEAGSTPPEAGAATPAPPEAVAAGPAPPEAVAAGPAPPEAVAAARVVCASSVGVLAVLVVAMVLMVAKP
jgi:hypothetical protein